MALRVLSSSRVLLSSHLGYHTNKAWLLAQVKKVAFVGSPGQESPKIEKRAHVYGPLCLVPRDRGSQGELERSVELESVGIISIGVCTPH